MRTRHRSDVVAAPALLSVLLLHLLDDLRESFNLLARERMRRAARRMGSAVERVQHSDRLTACQAQQSSSSQIWRASSLLHFPFLKSSLMSLCLQRHRAQDLAYSDTAGVRMVPLFWQEGQRHNPSGRSSRPRAPVSARKRHPPDLLPYVRPPRAPLGHQPADTQTKLNRPLES